MHWIDLIALWLGRSLLIAGGIGAATWLAMYPLDYAWRRWGDLVTFVDVMREARRQGRRIFGVKQKESGDA